MKNEFFFACARCCKMLAIKSIELMTWNSFMKNNEVASGGLVSLDATKEINETSTGSGLLSLSLDRLSKYDLLHPLFFI